MHIYLPWNFHQNVLTLNISFIDLNASIWLVLIHRPHPVLSLNFIKLFFSTSRKLTSTSEFFCLTKVSWKAGSRAHWFEFGMWQFLLRVVGVPCEACSVRGPRQQNSAPLHQRWVISSAHYLLSWILLGSVADPWNFGTAPDPRIHNSD